LEIVDYEIKYKSKSEHVHLIGLGDIHLGHAGCDKEKLQKTIEYIRLNDHCYWVGMGDYCECINVTDPRFDPKGIDPEFQIADLDNLVTEQYTKIKEMLLPIKDSCIGVLAGNHEEKIRLKYYRDIGLDLARTLKVRYLGYDGFIRLFLWRRSLGMVKRVATAYLIYAHHGWGASRTSGAKVNRLEDFCAGFDADIIMVGHEHKKVIAPPATKLTVAMKGGARLTERRQVAVMTGGFLKGYQESSESYIERKGYRPADLGVVKLTLHCEQKGVHASL